MSDKIDLFSLEELQKISVHRVYKNYDIFVYCAGSHSHEMYWAFVIFKDKKVEFGDRLHDCFEVEDGFKYCEGLIDFWSEPITYEEVCSWRNICEYCHAHMNTATTEDLIRNCKLYDDRLVQIVGKSRRAILWDKYKIQLIKWEYYKKHCGHWILKGNWEDKIHFLEQVYILDRDSSSLPRPWLDKWHKQVRQNQRDEIIINFKHSVNLLKYSFDLLEDYLSMFGEEKQVNTKQQISFVKARLEGLRERIKDCKANLLEFKNLPTETN